MKESYLTLLQSEEWKSKRTTIIERDASRCQNCLNQTYFDTKSITKFRLKPNSSSTFIIENQYYHELPLNRKWLDYLKLWQRPNDTLVVLFEEQESNCRVFGVCSLNKSFSNNDLVKERDFQINFKVESIPLESRQAVKMYLKSMPLDTDSLCEDLIKKYIKSENFDVNTIRWMDVKNLHVHHHYYQKNRLPWDYPDKALVTLCWSCHEKLHKNEKVPCLDERGQQISSLTPCGRCYGAGWFPEYNHVQNGVCFKCCGAKYEELI